MHVFKTQNICFMKQWNNTYLYYKDAPWHFSRLFHLFLMLGHDSLHWFHKPLMGCTLQFANIVGKGKKDSFSFILFFSLIDHRLWPGTNQNGGWKNRHWVKVMKVGSRQHSGRKDKWIRKVWSCCHWTSYEFPSRRSYERELESRTLYISSIWHSTWCCSINV